MNSLINSIFSLFYFSPVTGRCIKLNFDALGIYVEFHLLLTITFRCLTLAWKYSVQCIPKINELSSMFLITSSLSLCSVLKTGM